MSKLTLGIIEVAGLTAAVVAADTCVKSANVSLVGYEFSKGSGMTIIKVEGNVGAVTAAINSAIASVEKMSKVISYKVIARPSEAIELFVRNKDTVGYTPIVEVVEPIEEAVDLHEVVDLQEVSEPIVIETLQDEIEKKVDEVVITKQQTLDLEDVVTCNVCDDPMCTRKKGELRSLCMHY